MKKGFVYFIQDENGLVKIGISKSAKSRLKQLQTGSAQKLKLLGAIEALDYKELEKTFHSKYASSRVNGEWFDITGSEVESILAKFRKPENVGLKELSAGNAELDDLTGVRYQGTYLIPSGRNHVVAVVTSCEFDDSFLYVSEVSVGKGAAIHSQYEVVSVPSNWIQLNGFEVPIR